MAKVDGCWANVLDDCNGPLSAEHLVSVAIFQAMAGMPNNRAGRVNRVVQLRGHHLLPDGSYRLEDLTANILCRHHNNITSPLDQAGGDFARALEQWGRIDRERGWLRVNWDRRVVWVDGPRLERLTLKLAINNAFLDERLPIGGEDARPGWPTRELVEMVYGLRPITKPVGLFLLSQVGDEHNFEEVFSPTYFDNGRSIEGCVWRFLTLAIGVQFTPQELPERMFDAHPPLRGLVRLDRFNALSSGPTNVELRLRW